MTMADDNGQEFGGDLVLAAEYVLGVLSQDEREVVAARVEREPAFARLVDEWEAHFAPMAGAYEAVEPPAALKHAVDRRLFQAGEAAAPPADRPSIWASLAFWRGLAAVAVAALAIAIAIPYVTPPVETPQLRLVASLAADGSDVKYLAVYDPAHHEVGMSHVSGERAQGKDFQLWVIEGDKAPVSMGVIPVGSAIHLPVGRDIRAKLEAGAVLAVSLEPPGGSPTGQPTGPVVAAGDLKSI